MVACLVRGCTYGVPYRHGRRFVVCSTGYACHDGPGLASYGGLKGSVITDVFVVFVGVACRPFCGSVGAVVVPFLPLLGWVPWMDNHRRFAPLQRA